MQSSVFQCHTDSSLALVYDSLYVSYAFVIKGKWACTVNKKRAPTNLLNM